MDIAFREAGPEDIPLLAQMNHALIRDEGSENPMDTAQGFLAGEYTALLLTRNQDTIGYCLYRPEIPKSLEQKGCIYLRQYYILPSYRRQGLDKRAFMMLAEEIFFSKPIRLPSMYWKAAQRAGHFGKAWGLRRITGIEAQASYHLSGIGAKYGFPVSTPSLSWPAVGTSIKRPVI